MRPLVIVALAAGSWGLWSLFLRPSGLPGSLTSMIMLASVGVFALPFALREPRPRWDRGTIGLLALLTLADALNMITFFRALDHAPVAVAVLAHYLAPILVALSSPLVERTETRGARIAACVATIGLALVLEPWRSLGEHVALGAVLGAVSAIGYAIFVFTARRLVPRIGGARALSFHGLMAAPLLLPFALPDLPALHLEGVIWVAAGALFLATIGGLAFMYGLARIGSARASILTFAEPLVAVVAGWLAFGEALSPLAILGAALVLAAGIAVALAPTRPLGARPPA